MSDALLSRLSEQVFRSDKIFELPFLPGTQLFIQFRPAQVSWDHVAQAVANVANLPASFRSELEREIYAFYLRQIEDGSLDFDDAQAQIDWENEQSPHFPGAKAAAGPADVWSLIKLEKLFVTTSVHGPLIVQIEGRAAWDGEHGIVLTFRGNGTLSRIGGWGEMV